MSFCVKRLWAIIAFAAFAASAPVMPVFAADDPMAGLYGNTLLCRSATFECHVWYSADGTWKSGNMMQDDKGAWTSVAASGTFRMVGGGLCRVDNIRKTEGCAAASEVGHKLGDKWTAPSPRDPSKTQDYEIVAGHH